MWNPSWLSGNPPGAPPRSESARAPLALTRDSFESLDQPIVSVADITRPMVCLEVDEIDIGKVEAGQRADILEGFAQGDLVKR